jgi:hypothetical protein
MARAMRMGARLGVIVGLLWGCGDDGGQCLPDPALPPTSDCPAICSGGCEPGLCRIDCPATVCESMTITCPPDRACELSCHGLDACDASTIVCPPELACAVTCSEGVDACGDVSLMCGDASCSFDCDAAACVGSAVRCGRGACTSTCAGASAPTVDCGSSCACTEC